LTSNFVKNLNHYIKVYNAIDKETCDEILKNISKIDYQQHKFSNPIDTSITEAQSGNNELEVSSNNLYRNEKLEKNIWNSLYQYHNDIYCPWLTTWAGYSLPRWNKYSENKQMAPHVDRIKTLFDGNIKGDPTLTILCMLNDDFEGGEFIMFDNEVIPLNKGDIMIFPSNFLYPHAVMPVKSGVRYSCVSWSW
jgi:predicted 2-oxoglutarate/Fe(II)-dependent dioxygenase YbiX